MIRSLEMRTNFWTVLLMSWFGTGGAALAAIEPVPAVFGDFNDDGVQDFAMSAPAWSPSSSTSNYGQIRVVYGFGGIGLGNPLGSLAISGNSNGAFLGRVMTVGDFNCDGIDDLATRVEDGFVRVLFGDSASGLSISNSQLVTGPEDVNFPSALAAGNLGNPLAPGCDVLAIGVADFPSLTQRWGAVFLYHGQPGVGLATASPVEVDQDSPGVPGESDYYDLFGLSLAVGNFDGDSFEDLAVGVPGEDVGSIIDLFEGAVNVLYGGPDQLDLPRSQVWHQDQPWVAGGTESGDAFGLSLAVGDFDGDGFDDLAVGVPDESGFPSPITRECGAVNVIYGSAAGLHATQSRIGEIWSQDSDRIIGKIEIFDWFSTALAAGDIDNDGFDDLAIGVPGDSHIDPLYQQFWGPDQAGGVNVIYGSSNGLQPDGDQFLHQELAEDWVSGALEVVGDYDVEDRFGLGLAFGLVDLDQNADLVILSLDGQYGAANFVYGSDDGLTLVHNRQWAFVGDDLTAIYDTRNPPSVIPGVIDGIFTPNGEWFDVLPSAFVVTGGKPVAVETDDPGVESLVYAAVATQTDPQEAHLKLIFDFLPRTDTTAGFGEPIAEVRFPAKLDLYGLPDLVVALTVTGNGPGFPPSTFVTLPDGTPLPPGDLGIEAAAGFGGSLYSAVPHLQVEMKLPLDIPEGFPHPDGPLAEVPLGPGGSFEPYPGFWTASFAPNPPSQLVQGAVALLRVEPDGSVLYKSQPLVELPIDAEMVNPVNDGDGLATFAVTSYFAATIDPATMRLSNPRNTGEQVSPSGSSLQDVNGDGGDDLVLEFQTAELMASGVLHRLGSTVLLTGKTFSSEAVGGRVSGVGIPVAGRVSDGFEVPGDQLLLEKELQGEDELLTLTWGDSCQIDDETFSIYEGPLGAYFTHEPLLCDVVGNSATVPLEPGDHYYLVAPTDPDGVEGSHGSDGLGTQRLVPPHTSCLPRHLEDCP